MTETTGTGHPGWRNVRGEITARVRAVRESGDGIRPPLLLLGVMERVGSNWISDVLRPVTGQHNEPFRQLPAPRTRCRRSTRASAAMTRWNAWAPTGGTGS